MIIFEVRVVATFPDKNIAPQNSAKAPIAIRIGKLIAYVPYETPRLLAASLAPIENAIRDPKINVKASQMFIFFIKKLNCSINDILSDYNIY